MKLIFKIWGVCLLYGIILLFINRLYPVFIIKNMIYVIIIFIFILLFILLKGGGK